MLVSKFKQLLLRDRRPSVAITVRPVRSYLKSPRNSAASLFVLSTLLIVV
jgi:hypothetical protein